MKKTFLILKYELVTLLTRRSYVFMAFGIPLIGVIVFLLISVVRGDSTPTEPIVSSQETEFIHEGFVDEANDLRLDRRAVARPGRLNLPAEHRGAVQVRFN